MAAGLPITQIAGVTKSFHGRAILCGVDLVVEPGEIVAVIGHNGSGKTTLLRILATTVLPDDGSVAIRGVDALRDPLAAREEIGVTLADERAWYWRLSGRDNLEFFAALHGMTRRTATSKAASLLDRVGLTEAADQPFGEYSSGMRLRLSLARALLGDPHLLLLDEPTRSIDPPGADDFRHLIRDQVRETRAAAMVASHDLAEVCELAARALLLQAGRPPRMIEAPLEVAELGRALAAAR
jgi:ABC-2 type transport system ATP-binding protein